MNKRQRKTALITGCSKRIGRSMALYLGKKGYNIAAHYNSSKSDSCELVTELNNMGVQAKSFQLDLNKVKNIENFYKKVITHFKKVDILINNASIFELDSLATTSIEILEKHLNVNFKAPYLFSKFFVENNNKNKGNIINIIDQRVMNITPYFLSYTISKSALWTMTRSLAMSLAPNIRVNAIAPGPTLQSKRQSSKQFIAQIKRTPLKKQVKLEEINEALSFILNTESLTGQLFLLDSGQNMGWSHAKSKTLIDD